MSSPITRFGVLTPVQARPFRRAEIMEASIDEWSRIAGARPAVAPVLHRLGDDPRRIREALRVIPGAALYLTTPDEPRIILAGQYDQELIDLAQAIQPDTLVRINQEPNGPWKALWTRWTPATYRKVFDHIAERVGGRAWYCPILRERTISPSDWEQWLPESAVVGGFDAYYRDRGGMGRLKRGIEWWDKKGLPCAIGELGYLRSLRGSARWMRRVGELEGVDTIVYYDIDEWQLRPRSRAVLGRLMR